MYFNKQYSCGTMLLLLSIGVAEAAPKKSHPNIILMVTDDHGMDALGCYGNPVIKTPNLDKLAKEGVRFSNAYCTSASSAASRSVLLTGRYGHATGAYGHVHDYHHFSTYESVASLPVLLSKGGYYTARIGKYHVAPESVYHFDKTLSADPRNTVEMANNCKEVFSSKRPFFLYFCPDDPHRSDFTTAPEDWHSPNLFGNKKEGYKGVTTHEYSPEEVIVPPFLPDNLDTRNELAQYYQSIDRIDQGVGRLMELLKKSGKADNTIIIYISDNGMAFPGAKTTVYDAGIKLPCIIRTPGMKVHDKVNNSMISWVDMTPTLLDMAGVKYDASKFHGRTFRPVVEDTTKEGAEGWDKIYASHNFHEITMYYPMRVIHDREYKLIWNAAWRQSYPFASDLFVSSTWQSIERTGGKMYGGRKVRDFLFRPEFELYDIVNDPYEFENLAYKKRYKETLDKMVEELKEWQRQTKDPWYILWDGDAMMQGTGENL